jgi:septum formation protein
VTLTNPAALVQALAQLKAEHIASHIAAQVQQQPETIPQLFPISSVGTDETVETSDRVTDLAVDRVADRPESVLVLGCDSVLSLDGQIYGKPDSPEEAIARWQNMRGTIGELYTGHALIDTVKNVTLVNYAVTRVHFAEIDDATIAAYVATGEPLGCAGCFAIDGRGALFVEKIEGCHTNVIGLSLPLLRQMLNELGYAPQTFWAAA